MKTNRVNLSWKVIVLTLHNHEVIGNNWSCKMFSCYSIIKSEVFGYTCIYIHFCIYICINIFRLVEKKHNNGINVFINMV